MSQRLRDPMKPPKWEKLGLCSSDIHDLVESARRLPDRQDSLDGSTVQRWLRSQLAAERLLVNQQLEQLHQDLLSGMVEQLSQLSQECQLSPTKQSSTVNSSPMDKTGSTVSPNGKESSQDTEFLQFPTSDGAPIAHPNAENGQPRLSVKVQEAPEVVELEEEDAEQVPVLPPQGKSTKLFSQVVSEKGAKDKGKGTKAKDASDDSEKPSQQKEPNSKQRSIDAFLKAKGWRGNSKYLGADDDSDEEDAAPTDEGPLRMFVRTRIVTNDWFDIVMGLLIIANAIIMGIQLEMKGERTSLLLQGRTQEAEEYDDKRETFSNFEGFFTVVFTLELFLRLYVFRCRFFRESMNLIDVVVVTTSVLDLFGGGSEVNLTAARLIRMARIVRVLRVMRIANLVRSLRILVKTISSSVGALGWSMVLLAVIETIAALFLCQVLGDYITDESKPAATRKLLYRYFGDTSRSLLTMFEITLGGWSKVGRPIIEEVHPAFCVFFVFYVAGVSFAVMKVITAVFLRETLQVANNDDEMMIAEKMRQKNKYMEKIKQLFQQADSSGDGNVTWEEFSGILDDPKIKTWLAVLELEVQEVAGLFHLIDNGDGAISFDEFMSGLVRLKGSAKSVDVVTLLYENQKILRTIKDLEFTIYKAFPERLRGQAFQVTDPLLK
eukprot:gnl/MRDRNA2_/MRDRNA2_122547_c0_seq1.p1 gnl/MRDRNA2_/MRDRNA2_122547_c0~~gnl/MRDRNA2_/MRDRNA2_122547_c0_seq1.p1  ORF type:complete len:682 (-),score=145.22 gnl/MRDRNA2_/MRDRNA2_122547_c0_seq1:33-2021(-)